MWGSKENEDKNEKMERVREGGSDKVGSENACSSGILSSGSRE